MPSSDALSGKARLRTRRLVPDAPARRQATRLWLGGLGVRDADRAPRPPRSGRGPATTASICPLAGRPARRVLPRCPDPGMALSEPGAVRRRAARSRRRSSRRLVASTRTTGDLVQLFSTSQHLSELLIRDPALLDWLRAGPDGATARRSIDDLWDALADARSEDEQGLAIRAVPPARDAADRLQRHRPRPAAGGDHARPLGPGRCLRRGRLPAGPRPRRGALRRPARADGGRPRGSSSWRWANSAARS